MLPKRTLRSGHGNRRWVALVPLLLIPATCIGQQPDQPPAFLKTNSIDEPLDSRVTCWIGDIRFGKHEYTSQLYFFREGYVLHLPAINKEVPVKQITFGSWDYKPGGMLEIDWTTGKSDETGRISDVSSEAFTYEVTAHSDRTRVGINTQYERSKDTDGYQSTIRQMARSLKWHDEKQPYGHWDREYKFGRSGTQQQYERYTLNQDGTWTGKTEVRGRFINVTSTQSGTWRMEEGVLHIQGESRTQDFVGRFSDSLTFHKSKQTMIDNRGRSPVPFQRLLFVDQ